MDVLFIGGPAHGRSISVDFPPDGIVVPMPIEFQACSYTLHAVRDPEGIRRLVAVINVAMLDAMVAVGFGEREH